MSRRPRIKGKGADIYLNAANKATDSPKSPARSGETEQNSTPAPPTGFDALRSCFEAIRWGVAWSIEVSEMLAYRAIELHRDVTSWAQQTPLERWYGAQRSIARRFVEFSAAATRDFWWISSIADD